LRVGCLVAGLLAALLLPLPASPSTIIIIIPYPQPPPDPPEDGEDVVVTASSGGAENHAEATGGWGGSTYYDLPAGIGGDATAIALTEVGASPALASAVARGGTGGAGGYLGRPGGQGGDATATAVARNQSADPVTVIARASGGRGGACCENSNNSVAGDGGSAQLGEVYGASTGGGDVSVFGEVSGGDGGSGWDSFLPNYQDGAARSAFVVDAVDGSTAGNLLLHQRAVGGDSSISYEGLSGDAESRLSRSLSAASLDLVSEAIAGDEPWAMPAPGTFSDYTTGSGAAAIAVGEAENASGPVMARVLAIGGDGGTHQSQVERRDGGSAHARAQAISRGDGNAVVVGGANQIDYPSRYWYTGAWGGAGAESPGSYVIPGRYGNGGDASSESVGIALGDSSVLVKDLAVGGPGSFVRVTQGSGGGSASSRAEGSNAGSSPVEVSALALGGVGANRGGDATASASASGGGTVRAAAQAIGGFGPAIHPIHRDRYGVGPSAHHATARGSGPAGSVEAYVGDFAGVYVPLRTAAVVDARIDDGARPREAIDESEFDGFSHTTWSPLAGDLASALAGDPIVAEALVTSEIDSILLFNRVGATNHQALAEGDALTSVIQFQTVLPYDEEIPLGGSVLAFFAPSIGEEGFGSLRVRVDLGGAIFDNDTHVLIDETFNDADDARSYLAGLVLDPLGPCGRGCESELKLAFEFTSEAEGAHFSVGWLLGVQSIPEPSTALLVALGLCVLVARRARLEAV
jgi:hypothetical protein